jgi:hypothetical protein
MACGDGGGERYLDKTGPHVRKPLTPSHGSGDEKTVGSIRLQGLTGVLLAPRKPVRAYIDRFPNQQAILVRHHHSHRTMD